MAKYIFVANIGERDLQIEVNGTPYLLNGQPAVGFGDSKSLPDFLKQCFGETPQNFAVRHLGQWLLDKLTLVDQEKAEMFFDAVKCPILQPALTEALKHCERLDAVYLYGTNQPESVPKFHRDRDTYWAAQLIAKWLRRHFGDYLECVEVIGEHEERQIPTRWDEAYRLMAEKLRTKLMESEHVFAAISAGIPSINFGLQQVVLGICGRKATLIQVVEIPRMPSQVVLLDTWALWGDRLLRQIQLLLQDYDYSAALNLLESEVPEEQHSGEIEKVFAAIRHAHARLNFDFDQALKELEPYKNQEPMSNWLKTARHKTLLERAEEAINCLEAFRRTKRLMPFIILADALVETLTRIAAEKVMPSLKNSYVDEKGQRLSNPFVPRRFTRLISTSPL
ncbi:MAG: hypothetical protein ACK40X_09725, partial [Armatimonadota bacterium]